MWQLDVSLVHCLLLLFYFFKYLSEIRCVAECNSLPLSQHRFFMLALTLCLYTARNAQACMSHDNIYPYQKDYFPLI